PTTMTSPSAARSAWRGQTPATGTMTWMSAEGITNRPLVSVCVPAYRAERFIAGTIESVLRQTSGDWELLVVDDASPDRTFEIAARYANDPRVCVDRNATNLGPVDNWNRVVAQARGSYVKLLCSDDLLYAECLAHQAAALDACPSAGMVAGRRDLI